MVQIEGNVLQDTLLFMSKRIHDDYCKALAHLYYLCNTVMPQLVAKNVSIHGQHFKIQLLSGAGDVGQLTPSKPTYGKEGPTPKTWPQQ